MCHCMSYSNESQVIPENQNAMKQGRKKRNTQMVIFKYNKSKFPLDMIINEGNLSALLLLFPVLLLIYGLTYQNRMDDTIFVKNSRENKCRSGNEDSSKVKLSL